MVLKQVQAVKELFKKTINTTEVENVFEMYFGNNGVILRPKEQSLKSLCVKTPLTNFLITKKPRNSEVNMSEEEKKIFENLLTYSITMDIKMYNEFQKHKELVKYIPRFYYEEINKGHDFIIMDYIEGEYFESIGPFNCQNPQQDSLDYIYCLLISEGFDIADRLEAIYNREKSRFIIVDLGGLDHNSNYY
ncbi:hypothetical protein [Metabacillus litoralis]|uniref:hypothetical protein n=1 Tax=Metabacillus litoralis TaxID=152268 RepID=UPI00203E6EAA|nr:hypothetical protein [Metabacillus litoralis]MCM3412701.1 hypothetical protein [Metabacillus litoralis]